MNATAGIAVVTGGAGFLGSHMVDLLLSRGFIVRVIDNLSNGRTVNLTQHENEPLLTLDELDVRRIDPKSTVFRDADYVFHFAGIGEIVPSVERPIEYMSVNVQGTLRVLEASREAMVRKVVYAASSSCYGVAKIPTPEDPAIDLRYPYALSKYQGEQACFHWAQVYGLPVNSIRIFNAYGTRSRASGAYGAVFGTFLRQKLANEPFTVVGDGTQKRDFVYATDVVSAFFFAGIESASGEMWNVGCGNPISINRVVELLEGDVVYIPKRPGEPDCTWADISKITRDLNWRPKVSIDEGIQRLLHEISYWKDAPLWTPESIKAATDSWFIALSESDKRQ